MTQRWMIPVMMVGLVFAGSFGLSEVQANQRDIGLIEKMAAGSVPIAGEYWALIIGIDEYQHADAPNLKSAVKDATAVRDVLKDRYGFRQHRIVELLNGQATRINIEKALYQLGRQAGADDSVFIYYAGHGQYDKSGRPGWWVPTEADPKNPGTFIMASSEVFVGIS